jgi:predicted nucleic acid-binding protein
VAVDATLRYMLRNTWVRNNAFTYNYHRRAKCRVGEEVAGLREPRRLALKAATILIAEVGIEKDRKLWFRDQKRRERAPKLREDLRREDEVLEEDILAQANDASIACRRYSNR